MKIYSLIILSILTLSTFSCKKNDESVIFRTERATSTIDEKTDEIYKTNKSIGDSVHSITDSSQLIIEESKKAKETVESIKTDDVVKIGKTKESIDKIEMKAESIINESIKIDRQTKEISELNLSLKEVTTDLQSIKAQHLEVELERDEALKSLEEETKKSRERLMRMIAYLIIACLMGIGLSGFFILQGNKWGFGGVVACIGTLISSIIVVQFFEWIAIVGGILAIAVAVISIVVAWNRKKAIEEAVVTTEMAKDVMNSNQRKQLFGERTLPGLVDTIQSPSTKKLVQSIRKAKKKDWEPTIDREYLTN